MVSVPASSTSASMFWMAEHTTRKPGWVLKATNAPKMRHVSRCAASATANKRGRRLSAGTQKTQRKASQEVQVVVV